MTLTEKAAYIKGLIDGLKLDESKDETKVMKAILDLLSDMAMTVEDIDDAVGELTDEVDEIDEALADVEDELYGDCDCDDYDEYDDCDCFDDDEDVYYEVTCPTCGEVINLQEDVLLCGETSCPKCGEALEFDFSDIMDECDCGCEDCGHNHDED
ncbi:MULTISPECIES: CD1247 N-terminal domain-containing protein [unclassified Ruminococcus]|uniref:CD1247 N-terminal domain-containing protein n=1 Tax=unclassified Ruminococcus TaxID=2608920 RepID=UPI00210A1323|nr:MULTISPECIES: CD1247 N-terminal domain-containing protein [unclassified Ruminococcus]MCQ4021647.1 hypothetical protein [Ruminococcus sp. zg-924]MCQ4114092.1 hypothetical protein [Ruminococcus sp. zg-921]